MKPAFLIPALEDGEVLEQEDFPTNTPEQADPLTPAITATLLNLADKGCR